MCSNDSTHLYEDEKIEHEQFNNNVDIIGDENANGNGNENENENELETFKINGDFTK